MRNKAAALKERTGGDVKEGAAYTSTVLVLLFLTKGSSVRQEGDHV